MLKKKSLLWFFKKSLLYDVRFIKFSPWPFSRKILFICKKYYLLFVYVILGLKRFRLSESHTVLFGRKIYFDFRFGIAGYQAALSSHQRMLQIAEISEVTTVLDIGANVGYFSLLIRDLYPEARIIAVEPIEDTFRALEKNFAEDPNVHLVQKAVSNFKGEAEMLFDADSPAVSSLGNTPDVVGGSKEPQAVKVATLDGLVDSFGLDCIDILKIDVEGFEKHVLEGGKETLSNVRYLFLEVTVHDNPNYTFSELMSLLYEEGQFSYQVVAFRNFADKSLGELPTADFLFKNINIK